jgi:hypothetical protein
VDIDSRRGAGWLAGGLAALSAIVLAWRGLDRAAFEDPAGSWPWVGGDTWDWIAAGLVLRGVPIESGERPPLLPALTAVADWAGVPALAGLFGVVAMVVGTAVVARAAAGRAGAFVGAAVACALAVNQSWIRCGIEWMVDVPAGVLIAGAVAALAPAEGRPRWICAGLWLGAAALVSQVAVVMVVAWLWAWWRCRPQSGEARRAAIGALLAVSPALVWFGSKLVRFGTAADVDVSHWRFLAFDPGGVLPYLWQLTTAWGWPGMVFALVGAVVIARRSWRSAELLWLLAPLLVGGFFALAYRYEAPRFAVTILPLLVVPTAAGVARIAAGWRWVAAGLVLAGALAPLPSFEATAGSLPLIPGWRLEAPLEVRFDGSIAPQPADVHLARSTVPWEDLAWIGVARRLQQDRAVPAGGAVEQEWAGVILLDDDGEARYRRTRRLAVLARAPVATLPPIAAGWLCPSGDTRARAGFTGRRLVGPDQRAWWVVLPRGADSVEWCRQPLTAEGRELAEAVVAAAGRAHLLVEIDLQADWWVWLAFLIPSERLHVVTALDQSAIQAAANGPRRRLNGLETLPVEILGRQGLAVWREERPAPVRQDG